MRQSSLFVLLRKKREENGGDLRQNEKEGKRRARGGLKRERDAVQHEADDGPWTNKQAKVRE